MRKFYVMKKTGNHEMVAVIGTDLFDAVDKAGIDLNRWVCIDSEEI